MSLEKPTKKDGAAGLRQVEDGTAFLKRRRLVKGVFAAPMILTLQSGAANAATSYQATAMPAVSGSDPAVHCVKPGTANDPFPRCPENVAATLTSQRCDFSDYTYLGSGPVPQSECLSTENQNAGYLIVANSSIGSLV